MTAADVLIHINVGEFEAVPRALLERAVRHTVAREGRVSGEVSLTLMDDAGIGELNKSYLGKDGPTDVIAFSLGEGDDLLGDIYVGMGQAQRQAADIGVPIAEELARLAIHGTLHVLGHEHPEGPDRDASPMYALQESYLSGVLGDGEPAR
jgi:probable rRNA maturation factor